MERTSFLLVLAVGALGAGGYGCTQANASETAAEAQRSVDLTVYTQDFAQVSETRKVELTDGTTRIVLADVSHDLDQSTVMYDWPDGSTAQVTSTTFDLGTSAGQSLLEQLVGKEVTLVYRSDTGKAGDRETGVLEAADPGNVVVRVGEKLVINPAATIETKAGAVATMPRLTAAIENNKQEAVPLNLSYMTRGLSWAADYVMVLSEATSDIECWATVTNQTGIDYPAAKIKFVAGAPNRAVMDTLKEKMSDFDNGIAYSRRLSAGSTGGGTGAWAGEMKPEFNGELTAYPYESSATLRNNQTNRVLMMKEPKVNVTRDYSIRLPSPGWYGYRDATQRLKATLAIALKNTEDAGLGSPLPAGRVRVYEPAKTGAPIYIGASSIGNTPKDDRIDMTLTEVFNLYARGKLTVTKKIDKKRTSYTYEMTVSNEKDKALDVRLVAGFYGAWSITNESTKSTRPDSASAQWVVSVPAGGDAKLSYTVVIG